MLVNCRAVNHTVGILVIFITTSFKNDNVLLPFESLWVSSIFIFLCI